MRDYFVVGELMNIKSILLKDDASDLYVEAAPFVKYFFR